jgi:rhodanese-related sulfurtransferase
MNLRMVNKMAAAWMSGAALVMAAGLVQAAETPPSLAGTTVVTADKVKELQAKGATVVDTRVANEYADSHIKGAISVPYKEKSAKAPDFDASQDSWDMSKLPADKGANLVLYCNAGECWKSYKSATMAVKAGYKHVFWFRGGMPEWKAKGFPSE